MSTAAKIAASQKNAANSTGPGDTSRTRFNALKTGLTARGLTPMDNAAGFTALLAQLRHQFQPAGPLEKFLVERIGLGMVRRSRAERLEAAYLASDLQRAADPFAGFLPGTAETPLAVQTLGDLCNLAARYETATARRLHADIQLLLSLQRARGKAGFVL